MFDGKLTFPRRGFLANLAMLPVVGALLSRLRIAHATVPTPDIEPFQPPSIQEDELAKRIDALMKHVDPAVAYQHAPIDPAKNAWPLWKQAMEALVAKPNDEEYENALEQWFDQDERPHKALELRVEEWVRANESAISLVDQGIVRGQFELPRATKSLKLSLSIDVMAGLRDLAKVKYAKSRLYLHRGDVTHSMREGLSIVRMGQLLSQSECLLVDYFVAHAILGIGLSAAYCAAMSPTATTDQGREAVRSFNDVEPDNSIYRQVLCVEFCRYLMPDIASIPETSDPRKLATHLLAAEHEFSGELPDDQSREFTRAAYEIATILEAHPDPFSQEATVRLASDLHLRYFAQLDEPDLRGGGSVLAALRQELNPWPSGVNPNFWNMVAADPDLDAKEIGMARPTTRQLIKARNALRRVSNVIGKKLIADSLRLWNSDNSELFRARCTSLQLRIALSHYERSHGALPDQLDELSHDGWFVTLPLDPFNHKPFQYAKADRLIWCAGKGGEIDGPTKLHDGSFSPGEFTIDPIWSIPKQAT